MLSGVELEVSSGDFLLVGGPNGGGKSTLLRGLLGTLPPRAGARIATPGLRLGWVPQRVPLDPRFPLDALDVVRMGLWGPGAMFRGKARVERERALEALARTDMADRARRLFGDLSGGQQQRVLLARALVCAPQLLLLDEPTSGVDADAVDGLRSLLSRFRAEAGLAVVMVTHQPAPWVQVADHGLRVGEGVVRSCAPAELQQEAAGAHAEVEA